MIMNENLVKIVKTSFKLAHINTKFFFLNSIHETTRIVSFSFLLPRIEYLLPKYWGNRVGNQRSNIASNVVICEERF